MSDGARGELLKAVQRIHADEHDRVAIIGILAAIACQRIGTTPLARVGWWWRRGAGKTSAAIRFNDATHASAGVGLTTTVGKSRADRLAIQENYLLGSVPLLEPLTVILTPSIAGSYRLVQHRRHDHDLKYVPAECRH